MPHIYDDLIGEADAASHALLLPTLSSSQRSEIAVLLS